MKRLEALCNIDLNSTTDKSNINALFSSASIALRNVSKIDLVHGSSASSSIGKDLVEYVKETGRFYPVLLEARTEAGASLILQSHERGILVAILSFIDEKGSANSRIKEKKKEKKTQFCLVCGCHFQHYLIVWGRSMLLLRLRAA